MRMLILICCLASTASAEETRVTCEALYTLGEAIMKARQANTPIHKLIEALNTDIKEARVVAEELAFLAYKKDRHTSEALQKQAAQDFANTVYIACVEAAKNQQ